MRKIFFFLLLVSLQVSFTFSQDSYPESYSITGFPSQNQSIYAGWIEANTTTGSLLYYQLYSKNGTDVNSTSSNINTPLIIYLEGGPGDPTTFTAFTEIGPYLASADNIDSTNITLEVNPHSFAQNYHLLVLDQPVGTGFSVRKNGDVVTSANQAADNLLTFFARFYELYPDLKDIPTYFFGHSYGGKWVPTLLYKWLQDERFAGVNVAGMILGNGLVEPISQFKVVETAYNMAILNNKQRDYLLKEEKQMYHLYKKGSWVNATLIYNNIRTYLQAINETGGVWQYNFLLYLPDWNHTVPPEYATFAWASTALTDPSSDLRRILKIPEDMEYEAMSSAVELPLVLSGDFMNSTVYAVEYILKQGIQTLIYAAQFDAIILYPGTINYVSQFKWKGACQWNQARKSPWYDAKNETVAGYYQEYGHLHFAVVNGAGHFSIFDKGQNVLLLVDNFINHGKIAQ